MTAIAPVQSLLNMETMLYGAPGMNMSVPNYLNGYTGVPYNAYDSLANAYGYLNPDMYYNSAYDYNSAALNNTQTEQTINSIQNSKDMKTLAEYYEKSLSPSESLGSAIIGMGVVGALMNHPRYLAHPINSFKGTKDVREMFKGVRTEGSNLNKLWKANNEVMREAYFQMHKASSRQYGKLGLFRKKYTADEYKQLKELMEKALKSGNIDEVAKASQTLKHAYVNNGGFFKLWNAIRGKEMPTVASRITDTAAITKNTQALLKNSGKISYAKALKKGGIAGPILFLGIELLCGIEKIKTAYSKDKETGNKQLGQTLVKGAGNAIGWAAGEAAGIWATAAIGAKIGTAFGPGVGTLIGGLAGMVGGAIGMWLTGKATKALVGEDVANKVEAENLTKTPEGQLQLLQLTAQTAQSDKNLDPKVQTALQNIVTQLA